MTERLRLLVPVDLMEASAASLRTALALAVTASGEVEAVYALPDEVEAAGWSGEADDELLGEARLRRLERFAAQFLGVGDGVPAPILVRLLE